MLTVQDIMTKPVVVIRSSATVQNAILLMRAKQVRSLIVEKTDSIPYGIETEKDKEVGFNREEALRYLHLIAPQALIFELSVTTGVGLPSFYAYLGQAISQCREKTMPRPDLITSS